MSVTGGIKLFSRSQSLLLDGVTAIASSGQASADRALDRNPVTYWRTVGSTDAATETYEVVFASNQTFDRIFLLDHNFKSYNVKYFSGGAYVHFANVVGIDGSMSNITETVYARDTSYYEFSQVTTSKIQISVTTTQVANAQKYLSQALVCTELGTLQGYPMIKGTELNRQLRIEKMLSGRALVMKSDEVFSCQLEFKDYPASLSADIDLIFSLQQLEASFTVWLCGGRTGSAYFKKQMRGYRLRDVFPVVMTTSMKPVYSKNVYQNPVDFAIGLQETAD